MKRMSSEWKWKAIAVLVSFVGAIYLLLPTALQVEQRRAEAEKNNEVLPYYYNLLPKEGLTLGLDLQGGIYVELEVALDEAVERKTDILGEDIRRQLKEESVTPVDITQSKLGKLDVTFSDQKSFDTFEEEVYRRYYRRTLSIHGIENKDTAPVVHLYLTDEYKENLETSIVEQATESVRNRINRFGVGEPDIRRQGRDRIAIEMPGLQDPERILSIMKRTGQLEFRMVHEVASSSELAAQQQQLQLQISDVRQELKLAEDDFTLASSSKINDALKDKLPKGFEVAFELVRDPDSQKILRGIPYLVEDKARVTGDMLDNAYVTVDRNDPKVAFSLNKTGTKIFADVTRENVDHFFAIMLDGTVTSAPSIREPILQGSGVITLGSGTFEAKQREAHDLTLILQEGALPATLTEATKTVVGPTLGAELIAQGFKASWMASLAVVIFMLLYYRTAGLIADLALFLNVLMILAILTIFGATLTLPGIAGIVLTIGMAVDANVIINERILEELRSGKTILQALHEGYANAKRAILDANITTLIAGIVLFQFGTGSIKGFAVTLCIGIVTTLFTAVVATRVGFDYVMARRRAA